MVTLIVQFHVFLLGVRRGHREALLVVRGVVDFVHGRDREVLGADAHAEDHVRYNLDIFQASVQYGFIVLQVSW